MSTKMTKMEKAMANSTMYCPRCFFSRSVSPRGDDDSENRGRKTTASGPEV